MFTLAVTVVLTTLAVVLVILFALHVYRFELTKPGPLQGFVWICTVCGHATLHDSDTRPPEHWDQAPLGYGTICPDCIARDFHKH